MTIPDSVHGAVTIPDIYESYLDMEPLIRLRNIRQLGFTPIVYTGAVHTRFEHTIGKTGILLKLLDQFGVRQGVERDMYILASILSEIGTFPFSYSTRWLFVHKMGMSKYDFARSLSETYIEQHVRFGESDRDFFWNADSDHHKWFGQLPAFSSFPGLTILKLAGDIDYALRDAHYSGRYANNFDFRYFQTLVDLDSESCQRQLTEAVRELYRSIYALNAVYGDIARRFIMLVAMKLCGVLVDGGYLLLDQFRDASKYVKLDDDRFLSLLRKAADGAFSDGLSWARTMFETIEQLRSLDIKQMILTDELKDQSLAQIERCIAEDIGCDERQVIAFSDSAPNEFGYVLFGKFFSCYEQAISSPYFGQMTGLIEGGDRTGLMGSGVVYYTIMKPD